ASCAFSQTSTTSLQGTVTDPAGGTVADASIILVQSDSKTERTATTGSLGEYRFQFLFPGTYRLTVSAPGFARYEQTDLPLLVNTPATVNVQLKLGVSSESVKVTSEAPAINMVDASLGNAFDETQVRQIPLD